MLNKYPFTAIGLGRAVVILIFLVGAFLGTACVSNPTPHPAADASVENGGYLGVPSSTQDAQAGATDPEAPWGHDVYSADGYADDTSDDAVSIEDGGGVTEPAG